MKNSKLQTFQESGVTIKPYDSFPTITGCKVHEAETRTDGVYKWEQCKVCAEMC